MALHDSVLLEMIEMLRIADGGTLLRRLRGGVGQAEIDAEATEHIGAAHEGARVVIDGKYVTAAGVSAGIDVALSLAAMLTSDTIAQPPDYRVRPSASVPCAKARDGTGRGRCPRT